MNKIKNIKTFVFNISPNYLIVLLFMLIAFKTGDNKSNYNVPSKVLSACAVDYDLDGDNDIIVRHQTLWQNTNPTLSILNNTGNGYFEIADTSLTFCGSQSDIFAININDDDYPDIITFLADFSSGEAERFIRILYGNEGAFSDYEDFNLNKSETFTDINYGDINGDSLNDIVVISGTSNFWGILLNDGNGGLLPPDYHYVADYYPLEVDCGDLNDDGRDDIVIVGQNTEVYFSYPGYFEYITLDDFIKEAVEICDMDNDGDNDIVVLVNLYLVGLTGITIYENLGENEFYKNEEILFQPPLSYMAVSDINNDDLPDMVCTGEDGLHILMNEGNLVFTLPPQFIEIDNYGASFRKSVCATLDNNTFNDIVIIRGHGAVLPANITILFNDTTGNFVNNPLIAISNPLGSTENGLKSYPNPFKSETIFEFFLNEKSNIGISIHSISGTLIKTLISEKMKGGNHLIKWNGHNLNNELCKSGTYIVFFKKNGVLLESIKLIKN